MKKTTPLRRVFPMLPIVFFPGLVLPFVCSVFHPVRMCLSHPPNTHLKILKEKGEDEEGTEGKGRHPIKL